MSTHLDGFYQPHDIFAEVGLDLGQRAEILRTGDREPISPLVRQLVYRRDEWTCQHCGAVPSTQLRERRSGPLHLDHIVPWSAGGPDRTDNLRTLCADCNQRRSNFVSEADQPATPIVGVCALCLCRDAGEPPDTAFQVYCGSRSHFSWAIPGWHIL